MCTAIVTLRPGGEWPLLVAFVRDEDRDRPNDPPARWWPSQPTIIGGRDRRAGGTWLAIDTSPQPALAFVLNRLEPGLPPPMQAGRASRGLLPTRLLSREHAPGPEIDPAVDVPQLAAISPCHMIRAELGVDSAPAATWWQWDGHRATRTELETGTTVIGSRGATLDGEPSRRAAIREQFAPSPSPRIDGSSQRAWGRWIELLDGRDVQHDDLSQPSVRSVSERPGFGTVGASLVGMSRAGHVRYDVNATHDLDPGSWSRVELD